MEFGSFLVSLGTSFVIFVILMLLFTWLSRKSGNAPIYYPNRILKGLEPWEGTSLTRNPFAWMREALTSSEQDVVNLSGVDTAVHFVFLSTGSISISLCSSLFSVTLVVPVQGFGGILLISVGFDLGLRFNLIKFRSLETIGGKNVSKWKLFCL